MIPLILSHVIVRAAARRSRTTIATLALFTVFLGACRDVAGVHREASRLVFTRDSPYDTLYVANPDDGVIEQRIGLPMSASRVRLSPFGDRLALISDGQLWVMNLDGDGARVVAMNASNMTWSPDGLRLAYVRLPGPELRLVGADGAGDVVVPGAAPGGWLGLAWSPDGVRIAFEGMRRGASGDARTIYLVNVDGTELWDFDLSLSGPEIRSSGEPTWSPDGRQLGFSRYVIHDAITVEKALWVATLATGQARRITSPGGSSDVRPTWSPRGSQIAFLRFNGDRSDVFVVRPDGKGLRQLTSTPSSREEAPHWMRR